MIFFKNIKSAEYLELKKSLESLRIEFASLVIEFEMIVKKLKFKYKLQNQKETEDLKDSVLLPE